MQFLLIFMGDRRPYIGEYFRSHQGLLNSTSAHTQRRSANWSRCLPSPTKHANVFGMQGDTNDPSVSLSYSICLGSISRLGTQSNPREVDQNILLLRFKHLAFGSNTTSAICSEAVVAKEKSSTTINHVHVLKPRSPAVCSFRNLAREYDM